MEFKVERKDNVPGAEGVRSVEVDGSKITSASDADTLKKAYRSGFEEIQKLDGTLDRTEDQNSALFSALDAVEAFKGWLAPKGRIADLEKFTKQSTGVPSLAGESATDARAVSMRPMVPGEGQDAATRIRQRFGEGEFEQEWYKNFSAEEYGDAFRTMIRMSNQQHSPAYRDASNTLQVGYDPAGGYQVPEELYAAIIGRAPAPTRIAGSVTQVSTSRDSLTVPTYAYDPGGADPGVSSDQDIYTTPIRPVWTSEGSTVLDIGSANRPSFGADRIWINTAMLRLFVTLEMLEDSAFPVMEYVTMKMGEAIDLVKDSVILSGSGRGQPRGILFAPNTANNPATIPSAVQGVIDADSIKKVAWSLPEQYEENSKWVFNKKSFAYKLDTLVDGEGRYLWNVGMANNGIQDGYGNLRRPLLGFPTVFSAFMPDIGNGSYSAIFGDLSGYFLVNRIGFTVEPIREKYYEQGLVALVGRLRLGGQIVEPWKMKIYQVHS